MSVAFVSKKTYSDPLETPASLAIAAVVAAGNTQKAFEYANAHGAQILEADMVWTKDKVIVLTHDVTLNPTTNCTGRVDSRTSAYIAKYCRTDAGGFKIWSLKDLLTFAMKNGRSLAVEVKDWINAADAKQLAVTLQPWAKYTIVDSFRPPNLPLVNKYDKSNRLRFAYNTYNAAAGADIKKAKASGAIYMFVNGRTATQADMKLYRKAGLIVWGYVAYDKEETYERFMKLGFDGYLANNPATLRKFLSQHS